MAGPADQEKHAILGELSAARERLSATGDDLRRALDLPTRARKSFRRYRPAWLGGAAVVGLALSKIPARSKTVFVERATGKALGAAGKLGAVWAVAKVAFDFARPLMGGLAGKPLSKILKRFARLPKKRMPGDIESPS